MDVGEDAIKPGADCAVCLLKCNHPTQLPCGHVFCFICAKGIALQNKICAMCRAAIPPNYLDNPILLETLPTEEVHTDVPEINQWFYEGRNGWWKYDERSNVELETAYNAGNPMCTLILAGTSYNIDFHSMTQIRRNDQTRRRRVRRDTSTFPSKGIAGIKTDNTIQIKDDDDDSDVAIISVDNEVIEISDNEDNVLIEPPMVQDRDGDIEIRDSEPELVQDNHEVVEIGVSEVNILISPGLVQADDIIHILDGLSAVNLEGTNIYQDHEDTSL